MPVGKIEDIVSEPSLEDWEVTVKGVILHDLCIRPWKITCVNVKVTYHDITTSFIFCPQCLERPPQEIDDAFLLTMKKRLDIHVAVAIDQTWEFSISSERGDVKVLLTDHNLTLMRDGSMRTYELR